MLCCRHAENSSVEAARSFGGETFGCYVVGMPKTHLLKQCNLFFFGEETFEFYTVGMPKTRLWKQCDLLVKTVLSVVLLAVLNVVLSAVVSYVTLVFLSVQIFTKPKHPLFCLCGKHNSTKKLYVKCDGRKFL